MDTSEQFLADRRARMSNKTNIGSPNISDILDNPIRRHETDGIGAAPAPCPAVPQSRTSVLTEAENLIHGARNSDYGHPLDNHGATADLMSAYVSRKYGIALKLDAEDVCIFNVLQKVSRLANTPDHRDSLVDIGGYVGCVEMIQDERAARA